MVSKWVITPIHPIYIKPFNHLLSSWDIQEFQVVVVLAFIFLFVSFFRSSKPVFFPRAAERSCLGVSPVKHKDGLLKKKSVQLPNKIEAGTQLISTSTLKRCCLRSSLSDSLNVCHTDFTL